MDGVGCVRGSDGFAGRVTVATAFGGYGERVTDPSEIVGAIKRGIQKTQDGTPALLEFITGKEIEYSVFR